MRWFRFYDDVLDDQKVQKLPPHLFKAWVNLLCLASKHDGKLPSAEIAFRLRMSEHDAQCVVEELILVGLIDIDATKKMHPHNWQTRQFKSDASKERTRKWRKSRDKKPCDVTVTASVTASDASCDGIESYTESEEDSASSSFFMRPREKKHDLSSDFEKETTTTEEPERLKRVAEGLGLDVGSILDRVNDKKPKNRGAYFTKVAVNDFRDKYPKAPEKAIRAALWGNDAALGKLLALAVGANP